VQYRSASAFNILAFCLDELFVGFHLAALGTCAPSPRRETVKAFQGSAREVCVVGDCLNLREPKATFHDTFAVAVEM
jgi:hypothetical protein